jgi:hypothetical protein
VNDIGPGSLSFGFFDKVSFFTEPEYRNPEICLGFSEYIFKFIGRPDVKLSFLALAVGIFGRKKGAQFSEVMSRRT